MTAVKKLLTPLFCCAFFLAACSKGGDAPKPDPVPVENHTGEYYVSPKGNDANNGLAETPMKSINKALLKANAGETVIVRGGVYNEKVVFPKSGEPQKYITLKAYPGEQPVIDGTGITAYGQEGMIVIGTVSYIVVDGMEVCNLKTNTGWTDVNGILVRNGSSHITLKNNKVHNIENHTTEELGRVAHGILVIGNTNSPLQDILVSGNQIHDCVTGLSENLTVNGYVDGFTITGNKVYNGENIGICVAGGYSANPVPALNYARNGVVSDNEVYRITDHGAAGIYVDGAKNIVVERNRSHDNKCGIGVVSETLGFPAENCIVRNNFIYNNDFVGMYMGGYNEATGGTLKCYFINNTLLFNNRTIAPDNNLDGEIRMKTNCVNNVIANNIIYARADRGLFINKEDVGGSGNTFNYNHYYCTGAGKWVWDQVTYNTADAWKAAVSGDAASVSGTDPLLVSTVTPDLHLQTGSPAKNSGQIISAAIHGDTDIDGKPRITNNAISKGAQQ